jgi:hypothetical protein
MSISDKMRKELVKEIRYASTQMKNTSNISEKLYFFSAVYGILNRIFNFEYSDELIFMHQIIRQTFDSINSSIHSGQKTDINPRIPNKIFDKLQDSLEKLASNIEAKKEVYSILKDISVCGYSAVGNGYYLYLKGMLKI